MNRRIDGRRNEGKQEGREGERKFDCICKLSFYFSKRKSTNYPEDNAAAAAAVSEKDRMLKEKEAEVRCRSSVNTIHCIHKRLLLLSNSVLQ